MPESFKEYNGRQRGPGRVICLMTHGATENYHHLHVEGNSYSAESVFLQSGRQQVLPNRDSFEDDGHFDVWIREIRHATSSAVLL